MNTHFPREKGQKVANQIHKSKKIKEKVAIDSHDPGEKEDFFIPRRIQYTQTCIKREKIHGNGSGHWR
jgi:hypothetical protein